MKSRRTVKRHHKADRSSSQHISPSHSKVSVLSSTTIPTQRTHYSTTTTQRVARSIAHDDKRSPTTTSTRNYHDVRPKMYPRPGSFKKYHPWGTTVKPPREYNKKRTRTNYKYTDLAKPPPVDPMAFDDTTDQILSDERNKMYVDQKKQTYRMSILPREHVEYDFAIVGGGPAGLATAIRLKQLSLEHSIDVSVCLLEKGPEIGSQVLGGDVLNTESLTELLPTWRDRTDFPQYSNVTEDQILYLRQKKSYPLPVPKMIDSYDHIVLSLGKLTSFLGQVAEDMGVEVFSSFPASEIVLEYVFMIVMCVY